LSSSRLTKASPPNGTIRTAVRHCFQCPASKARLVHAACETCDRVQITTGMPRQHPHQDVLRLLDPHY
jgi:hypothetical protein